MWYNRPIKAKEGASLKFLHISDLHFGKTIHGINLIDSDDQPVWVDRFLALAERVMPQAVVIAGDVYDRSAPSEEAVKLLSRMVTALKRMDIAVLISAGNHDSGKRLSFASELLATQGVYMGGELDKGGAIPHVTLNDAHGPVTFWMMPYVFPAMVREALGAADPFPTYDAAVRALLAAQDVNTGARNVILAHQFVTANGSEVMRGGSESMVAGLGQIDYTAFDAFEYAALGHIHRAYAVGRDTVRYAGSPLCYHFNETMQEQKGPLLIELGAKGAPVGITLETIEPLHRMRTASGTVEELKASEQARAGRGEYVRLEIEGGGWSHADYSWFERLLEERGSRLLEFVHTSAGRGPQTGAVGPAVEDAPVEERFARFYETYMDDPLSDAQRALTRLVGEMARNARDVHAEPAQKDIEDLIKALTAKEVRA